MPPGFINWSLACTMASSIHVRDHIWWIHLVKHSPGMWLYCWWRGGRLIRASKRKKKELDKGIFFFSLSLNTAFSTCKQQDCSHQQLASLEVLPEPTPKPQPSALAANVTSQTHSMSEMKTQQRPLKQLRQLERSQFKKRKRPSLSNSREEDADSMNGLTEMDPNTVALPRVPPII